MEIVRCVACRLRGDVVSRGCGSSSHLSHRCLRYRILHRFADLAVLTGVREYPSRHASTLLAFEAAAAAVREAVAATDRTRRAA